ncbi:amino acid ABC transporter permease [Jatrophihabitans fulvus]
MALDMTKGGAPSADGWTPSPRQQERDRYRRRRTRRSGLIGAAVALVVLAVVVVAVRNSTGWPLLRDSFFDFSVGFRDLPALLRALWVNVQIMLIAEVAVLLFAGLIAILRTLQGPVFFPLRFVATAYVDLFRGLPILIVLYLVGFGLPSLRIAEIPDSPFVLCIVALVLTYSAYVAEVFRAGIESVHPSQRAAARSLGLTTTQTMRFVVLPQAVRRVLPPLLNDFVSLQKDTSLVSTLAVSEMVLVAQGQVSRDFKFVHYIMAGLIFVLLAIPLTRLTDWLARRQGWTSAGATIR